MAMNIRSTAGVFRTAAMTSSHVNNNSNSHSSPLLLLHRLMMNSILFALFIPTLINGIEQVVTQHKDHRHRHHLMFDMPASAASLPSSFEHDVLVSPAVAPSLSTSNANAEMPMVEESNHSWNATEAEGAELNVCVNCHALFQIHVIVDVGKATNETLSLSEDAKHNMNMLEENHKWMVSLQDIESGDGDEMHVEHPVDLHCEHYGVREGSIDIDIDAKYPFACRSVVKLLVPYSSLWNVSMFNHGPYVVGKEVIVMASLMRVVNANTHHSRASRRRVVDQWLVNVAIPTTSSRGVGDNGGHVVGRETFRNPIYSVKLKDGIVLNGADSQAKRVSTFEQLSEPTWREVGVAIVIGLVGGIIILFAINKFMGIEATEMFNEKDEEEQPVDASPDTLTRYGAHGPGPRHSAEQLGLEGVRLFRDTVLEKDEEHDIAEAHSNGEMNVSDSLWVGGDGSPTRSPNVIGPEEMQFGGNTHASYDGTSGSNLAQHFNVSDSPANSKAGMNYESNQLNDASSMPLEHTFAYEPSQDSCLSQDDYCKSESNVELSAANEVSSSAVQLETYSPTYTKEHAEPLPHSNSFSMEEEIDQRSATEEPTSLQLETYSPTYHQEDVGPLPHSNTLSMESNDAANDEAGHHIGEISATNDHSQQQLGAVNEEFGGTDNDVDISCDGTATHSELEATLAGHFDTSEPYSAKQQHGEQEMEETGRETEPSCDGTATHSELEATLDGRGEEAGDRNPAVVEGQCEHHPEYHRGDQEDEHNYGDDTRQLSQSSNLPAVQFEVASDEPERAACDASVTECLTQDSAPLMSQNNDASSPEYASNKKQSSIAAFEETYLDRDVGEALMSSEGSLQHNHFVQKEDVNIEVDDTVAGISSQTEQHTTANAKACGEANPGQACSSNQAGKKINSPESPPKIRTVLNASLPHFNPVAVENNVDLFGKCKMQVRLEQGELPTPKYKTTCSITTSAATERIRNGQPKASPANSNGKRSHLSASEDLLSQCSFPATQRTNARHRRRSPKNVAVRVSTSPVPSPLPSQGSNRKRGRESFKQESEKENAPSLDKGERDHGDSISFEQGDNGFSDNISQASHDRSPLSPKPLFAYPNDNSVPSPASTVAATVHDFCAPRIKRETLDDRRDYPYPVPSGSDGQSKRLGLSALHVSADRQIHRRTKKKRRSIEKKLLATKKISPTYKPSSALTNTLSQKNEAGEAWQFSNQTR